MADRITEWPTWMAPDDVATAEKDKAKMRDALADLEGQMLTPEVVAAIRIRWRQLAESGSLSPLMSDHLCELTARFD